MRGSCNHFVPHQWNEKRFDRNGEEHLEKPNWQKCQIGISVEQCKPIGIQNQIHEEHHDQAGDEGGSQSNRSFIQDESKDQTGETRGQSEAREVVSDRKENRTDKITDRVGGSGPDRSV